MVKTTGTAEGQGAGAAVSTRTPWEISFQLDTKAAASLYANLGKQWSDLTESDKIQWRLMVLGGAIDSGTLSPSDLAEAKASQLYWANEASKQGTPTTPPAGIKMPGIGSTAAGFGIPSPFGAFMDAFKEFVKLLGDALQAIWKGFIALLDAIGSWLKKNLLDPLWRLVQDLLKDFGAVLASAMGVVVTAITNMVHPSSPLSPDMALPMFGTVAASMLAIQGTFMGVNATHPIKDLISPEAVAMVNKFLGFEVLSNAFWGSIGGEILGEPLRLWARMTFRARPPVHQLADIMLWHGQITEDEWHTLHTYEGWSDDIIRAHYASQWREPSVYALGQVMNVGGLSIEQVEASLRHSGIEPGLAHALAVAISRRPLSNELSQLRTQLITERVDGTMTEEELESDLQAIGVTDGEISLIRQLVTIRTARAQATQAAKDLKAYQAVAVQAATQAYERDLMDDGQFLEELLADGVEQLKAAQTLYLEQVKKIPRPKRVSSSA